MARATSQLEQEIDRLFQGPLSDFTSARNALSAQLKSDGHRDDASRVRSLAKPNLSSWAINQTYWHQRSAFDALLSAGERFRRAQSARFAGRKASDLQEASRAREAALNAALKASLAFLRQSSNAASGAVRDRIARTLAAIAAYGHSSPAEVKGRLSDDLNPPGFEALAALAPGGAAASAPLRLIKPAPPAETTVSGRGERRRLKEMPPRRNKPAVKEARELTERERAARAKQAARLRDAQSTLVRDEAALRLRQGEADAATVAAGKAGRDEREAATELDRLRKELEDATRRLADLRTVTRRAQAHATHATAALEKAERVAGAARVLVQKLESESK